MATKEQNDRNQRLHTQLLEKVSAEMTGDEVDKVKHFCESEGLGRGELEKMKNGADLFRALYDMAKFRIGEYEMLRTLLCDSETGLGRSQRFGAIIDKWTGKMVFPGNTGDSGGQGTSGNYSSPARKKRKHDPGSQSEGADTDDQDEADWYPRQSGKGHLVIFNNFTEERKGTEKDVERLQQFFKKTLGYNVNIYNNVDKDTMLEKLKNVRDFLDNDLNSLDYVAIAVLSHGDKKGIKTCKKDGKTWDENYVTQEELTESFKGDKLKRFVGKPKMFFIQACRGDERQFGYTTPDDKPGDQPPPPASIAEDYLHIESPKEADMMIYSSCTEGNPSYRDVWVGSWYVRNLVDVLAKYQQEKDLLTMLTMVNYRVAGEQHDAGFKQMPCIYSTLRKKVKL